MTVADTATLREQISITAEHLRSISLASLASPTAPGERSRASAALAVAQLLADLDAVLVERPDGIPADDDVVYSGESALGDQIAVIGRELVSTLESLPSADERIDAVCLAACDALRTLRMEM